VEQFGAGSGTEGVEALTEGAFEIVRPSRLESCQETSGDGTRQFG
jgi:hypothetical protein